MLLVHDFFFFNLNEEFLDLLLHVGLLSVLLLDEGLEVLDLCLLVTDGLVQARHLLLKVHHRSYSMLLLLLCCVHLCLFLRQERSLPRWRLRPTGHAGGAPILLGSLLCRYHLNRQAFRRLSSRHAR